MERGASGIVYGRNVSQHPKSAHITGALIVIVNLGAKPEQAMQML